MTKINSFDRDNVGHIGSEMIEALNKVGAKYGVGFSKKSIRYGTADFRVTVNAVIMNREEGVLTKAEQAYNMNREENSLPELGTEYFSKGITMTIVGWNTRARKYPVNLKGSDGRSYKNSAYGVRMATQ